MSYLRALAGDTFIYGLGYIIPRILNYLLIAIYLTWKFEGEQAQYGLYNDLYFYVALLLVLLTLRMETTFFRYGSEKENRGKAFVTATYTLICTALIWTGVLLFFRNQIAAALEYPGMGDHILILGLILTFDVLVAIPFASLRLDFRPRYFALLKFAGVFINILFVLFFLELCPWLQEKGFSLANFYDDGDKLYFVFLANLIASGCVFLVLLPKFRLLKFNWDPRIWRKMLAYTLPLVVVGIAGVINQSSYITFQKYILPNSIAENLSDGGVFAAATKVAILMNLFTVAFNYAAEPFFFHNASHKDARTIYAQVAMAFTAVASVLFLFILLYIDLIQLMLGSSFREGLYVVPILLMAYLFLGLYYNFSVWYKVSDRTKTGMYISLVGAAVTVGLNLLLLPTMEVVGSAWAALACYAVMVIACYLLGRKFYPIPYRIGRMFLILLLALGFYGASSWLNGLINGGLMVTLLINTVLLALFIAILYRLEGDLIRDLLKNPSKST